MLIVQKYGGSSLTDREAMRRVAGIIAEDKAAGHSVAVVVSAMGDTTDDLKARADTVSQSPSDREMDALITTGEQQSASLLAMTLNNIGIDAISLTGAQCGIITDGSFGDGIIKLILPFRVEEAIYQGKVPVIAGFQGITAKGDICSLGRGGSDTTAVAIAAALETDKCRIYTDVDGIYTADPRIVPEARKLDRIDFRDMLALSAAGSQVLHPRSVELGMTHGVNIELLSSFTGAPGTTVCRVPEREQPDFSGITKSEHTRQVTLAGKGADAGALSRAVLILGREHIEVESGYITSGAVSVRVTQESLIPALRILHREFLA